MGLEGKVVGISWQDIWWTQDERKIDSPWLDDEYIHFTYGLVLRDTDEWITITHEWRPQKLRHCGTTSIPRAVIRNVRISGDGELEATSEEGAGGTEPAPAGSGDTAEPTAPARAKPRPGRPGGGRRAATAKK